MKKLTQKQRAFFRRKSLRGLNISSRRIGGIKKPVIFRRIVIPEVFSLSNNFEESIEALNNIRNVIINLRGRVFIDFHKVKSIGNCAAIILAAEIFRCKHIRPGRGYVSINGNYPTEIDVYSVLFDLNFYKIIGVPELEGPPARDDKADLRIMMQSFTKIDPARISIFKEFFTIPFKELTGVAKKRMQGSIIEAMINSFEHAFLTAGEYPFLGKRAWLSGYINESQNEMAMIIFDQGIGIPESLPTTLVEDLRTVLSLRLNPTDSELISAASQIGRTSTHQPGRGKGFKTMRQFIDACTDAELRVFSNRGQFRYDGSAEVVGVDSLRSIGGTLVMLRVRHVGSELSGSIELTDTHFE